jgi:alkylation response protein AidB-like acyl-CoA dehydrogenase
MAQLGSGLDAETAVTILAEAGKICSEKLGPLNLEGDRVGCRLVDGQVVTPPGFAAAYQEFVSAGWPGLSGSPEYGGQGLPFVLQLWLDEMMSAANMSFGLFPGLTRGAAEALAAHGSEELKSRYLARLVSGEWTGAMALTEAAAGSDLSLIRTRAAPEADGSYRISGTKIFISSGDHDFGGNVVHLVLARLPDAPEGIKGISLFLVPKFILDIDGLPTVRNTMSVGALEKKMGIHAQPTCVMNYDGAIGWLVGQANRGLAAMFTMMNAERLMVGMQGLGIADAAYQQAVAYARDRKQGRREDGAAAPVPILEHGDVRRMLLNIRSFVEAGRALAGWTALQLGRAELHPDPIERARSDAFAALLTPVVKAALTDFGFESAVQAQQVFGGHGYIHEWGMEQYVRDARIAQIYEGTNGIQAIDLVSRKLLLGGGDVVRQFFGIIEEDVTKAAVIAHAERVANATGKALALLRAATESIDPRDGAKSGALAADYLRLFALVSFSWMWTRSAAAAHDDGSPLHKTKRALANYFAQKVLPQSQALSEIIAVAEAPLNAIRLDEM